VLRLSRKVLCLDWDKRSLRIVVARVSRGRTALEDAHSHRLPNTVDADDPEALGAFIRAMLRRHRLHHRSAVVDVPRERAVINRLRLPPTPLAEVPAAVRFQAMKELPFPLDTAAVDFVVMERDDSGLITEVLLAAVTLETLERVRLTCQAAGLTPTRIGLRPYANLISVRRTRRGEERRVLFLDVGPTATEIDIMHREALAFARSANVTVPLPSWEPPGPEEERVIPLAELADLSGSEAAVDTAIGELMVETLRTLQAYRATQPDATVDEVVVAGGTGIETLLADRLSQRLNLPVVLFDPTEALGIETAEAPKLRSFSAALGLAWGLGREGTLALDFLNPKRPVSARETLQRRARLGALAAAVVLLAVGVVLGHQYYVLARQYKELRTENDKLAEQARRKVELRNRIEEAAEWAKEAVWPDELLNITEHAFPPGTQPGEKMVVREIALDITGRSPGITLGSVHHTDWQVPTDFVNALNALRVGDQPLYVATQGTWTRTSGERYRGQVDIRIQLLRLQQFNEQAAERAKARKARLRDIDRVVLRD